jgi:8-amino-7-oxononanoate synthase
MRPDVAERGLVFEAARPGWGRAGGRDLLVLCTNDYLGLACDPRLAEAADCATRQFGFGARASRALGGDTEVHRELERELAEHERTESALVFSSGWACNVGVISALAGKGDTICSDALNHASIVDGCRLSGAGVRVYRHNDVAHLRELLSPGGLVVTDTVFSMDGDMAPVAELVALARERDATLILDDAHATGVFEPHAQADVLIGTLGKALGSVGGFVAGSRELVERLAATARSFLFTTAPPPPVAAAALAGLRIARAEPERREALHANARRLRDGLAGAGYTVVPGSTPIIPLVFEDEAAAARVARRLLDDGVLVKAVGPPYVPAGSSRLRVIASAAHSPGDVDRALAAFEAARP